MTLAVSLVHMLRRSWADRVPTRVFASNAVTTVTTIAAAAVSPGRVAEYDGCARFLVFDRRAFEKRIAPTIAGQWTAVWPLGRAARQRVTIYTAKRYGGARSCAAIGRNGPSRDNFGELLRAIEERALSRPIAREI